MRGVRAANVAGLTTDALFDSAHDLVRRDAERVGEAHDRPKGRGLEPALQLADVRAMHSREFAEALLRQPGLSARLTDDQSEGTLD